MRIRADSSLNKVSARALAVSVLPTPVGPRKTKEAIGRSSSLKPARERRIALAAASSAAPCPTTRLPSSASKYVSLSISEPTKRVTGIPVQRETTLAISSSDTSNCNTLSSAGIWAHSFCLEETSFSSWGICPYLSSAALSSLTSRSARSSSSLSSSSLV